MKVMNLPGRMNTRRKKALANMLKRKDKFGYEYSEDQIFTLKDRIVSDNEARNTRSKKNRKVN